MRKPIHLQMIGGKAPRQLIWEKIRALRQFTLPQLRGELSGGIDKDTTRTYVKCLVNGDFLSVEQLDSAQRLYTLEKDNGVEAPQLRKDGTLVTQGRPQENLWRTLRTLRKPLTVRELAAFASTDMFPVVDAFARDYLGNLHRAGYLVRDEQQRYLLLPSKDTGPRPPMIQRCKQVYDANTGTVVWRENDA